MIFTCRANGGQPSVGKHTEECGDLFGDPERFGDSHLGGLPRRAIGAERGNSGRTPNRRGYEEAPDTKSRVNRQTVRHDRRLPPGRRRPRPQGADLVSVENDRVLTQTGGRARACFEAVAYVTDQVRPGVACGYFNFRQARLDTAVNSVSPGQTDPINNRYRYRLGKGRLTRICVSDARDQISFLPRNLT